MRIEFDKGFFFHSLGPERRIEGDQNNTYTIPINFVFLDRNKNENMNHERGGVYFSFCCMCASLPCHVCYTRGKDVIAPSLHAFFAMCCAQLLQH